MNEIERIRRRIKDEMFITAYKLLLDQIAVEGNTKELLDLSKDLSRSIRSKAYMHAAKKQDNLGLEMESLLKLVIKLNGEEFYS